MTISPEDKLFFQERCVDTDRRLEWDDNLQVVTAKDRDGFAPNYSMSYKRVMEEVNAIRASHDSILEKLFPGSKPNE